MLIFFFLMMGLGFIFVVVNSYNNEQENRKELSEQGYNDSNALIILKYLGGIKTISAKNNVKIKLLKEGICFIYGIENKRKIIKYNDIIDIYIDTQVGIQEKVSAGKLLCFGVFTFAMKGKQVNTSKEYIVLKINEDSMYDIILECGNIQRGLDIILNLKNNYRKIV